MQDLISRQAAIDALHTWFRDGFEEDKWWNSTHVLAALEGVPSAQRWIPCSERLPETPDRVLVTIDWGDGDYEVSTDEYWSIDGVETEGWGDLHGEVVTAWMPLPEPYKER